MDGEHDEWEYDLSDLGEEPATDTIEAGTPTLEGVAFVVLGAIATVLALARMLPGL